MWFSLWSLVEGFFCQTTTSEERDLAGQGREEDSFLIDHTAPQFFSHSSQESEEDNARYVTTALLHVFEFTIFCCIT